MKIVTLDKDKFRAFEGLDPLEIHKQKGFTADFMLGAVSSGEEKDVPAGLLLGNTEKRELSLRWLFVDPESRRKSYAERLLSEAFLYAKEKGLEFLMVTFPKLYGYRSICRNDRVFFRRHGFAETEDGRMMAKLSDYEKYTEFSEPVFYDDDDMLDRLLEMEIEDEEEEISEDLDFAAIHKPWDVRKVGLREFSKLSSLQNFVKMILTGKKAVKVGAIGELTFSQFKEGVELCEEKGHTGFLKSLYELPVEYFDLDVSAYTMEDGRVTGMCLTHFDEKEKELIVELLYTEDSDNARGLAELIRYSLIAANKKYPPDLTVVLPNDEKFHKPFIKKLFGVQG
jgi:N-acetylglutamate synthase-like GNAT family acetyltransferase